MWKSSANEKILSDLTALDEGFTIEFKCSGTRSANGRAIRGRWRKNAEGIVMSKNEIRNVRWNAEYMMRNARSLQRVAQDLDRTTTESLKSDPLLFTGKLLAAPILFSLATEIALKALQCWEQNKAPERTHDLLKLFQSLEQNTQELLEARMRKLSPHSVWAEEPRMENLNSDIQDMLRARMHPLRDVLCSHCDANVHWRYLYERPEAEFETTEIDRALTVIIDAYDKRWRDSA